MKTWIFLSLALIPAAHAAEPMALTYSPECTLRVIAKAKNITLRDDMPVIFLESKTPLKQFQDAVEPQWGLRPELFLNAYIAKLNQIYLMDEKAYYVKHGRFMDDSLAHELMHYLQVKYKGASLEGADDSLESEAVEVQTWFREEFMKTGRSPCQGSNYGNIENNGPQLAKPRSQNRFTGGLSSGATRA